MHARRWLARGERRPTTTPTMFIEETERDIVFRDRARILFPSQLSRFLPIRFIAYDAVEEWRRRRGAEKSRAAKVEIYISFARPLGAIRIRPLISKIACRRPKL